MQGRSRDRLLVKIVNSKEKPRLCTPRLMSREEISGLGRCFSSVELFQTPDLAMGVNRSNNHSVTLPEFFNF